ncbi:EF-hand domain-containing protein [Rhizobacter sp. Root1221]|uniref:EF-hand domain-containing protein n=1 Tax=Rhizobacter sp. Root1221 TaxID=1736433 RepID=UPI00070011A1|nr:EF-hand domain-containing protein [Rhizobacter sp. Root1221]KQV85936.1 hypothetical protein ASC87_29635 [Rhizobacter sp. Root1221]
MNLTSHHWKPVLCGITVLLGLAAATSAAAAGTESAEAEILMMDKNGDGVLTAAEHAAGARTMFTAMDTDQDGRVTAPEMDQYTARTTRHERDAQPMSSAEKIKLVDANGDGVLTADEHRDASARMFDTMDTDRDGTLDRAELATGHAKMLLKRPK